MIAGAIANETPMNPEFISTFDIFKVSLGPSSSHTMGPMLAALAFIKIIQDTTPLGDRDRILVHLYGSLALTGRGHRTDRAVALGLAGLHPSHLDQDAFINLNHTLDASGVIELPTRPGIQFSVLNDIVFHSDEWLAEHPNGIRFELLNHDELLTTETYFSVGGGFIQTRESLNRVGSTSHDPSLKVPFPFRNATELVQLAHDQGLTIAEIMLGNERSLRSKVSIVDQVHLLMQTMMACIERGLEATEQLPGSLHLMRRAPSLYQRLTKASTGIDASDWLSVFALAVNEENAAGHQVVTAPTNGAAGVIPAVLAYFTKHLGYQSKESISEFLFTAAAFGSILKRNASISGAEAGCQAEVGGAAAMAAAGLCAVLGGTPLQIENAAEIALEHHLGLTCDPVHGLVQIPCIERNAFGATKAYLAAKLALHGDGNHRVSFDQCVESLKQIGADMSTKYKETSLGGLAVNVTSC